MTPLPDAGGEKKPVNPEDNQMPSMAEIQEWAAKEGLIQQPDPLFHQRMDL